MALLTTEQRLLAPVLNGAQTVWTGRPLPGLRLRSGDAGRLAPLLFIIPFFVFWESMAMRVPKTDGFGIAFPIFGLAVFSLMLWHSCGDVVWNLYARGRTYYALTADGYAIMFTDLFGGTTKRVYLPSLSAMNLEMKADGSGSITFGEASLPPWWMRNNYTSPRPPAFERIPDAATVYDLCTKLQQGKSA